MKNNLIEIQFEIESDLEFYCFLKAHLPNNYRIVSEPIKSYYSEWYFHYKIYHKSELFREYKGDFQEIKKGYLLRKAKKILRDLGVKYANRK